jgi:hypothetical protein
LYHICYFVYLRHFASMKIGIIFWLTLVSHCAARYMITDRGTGLGWYYRVINFQKGGSMTSINEVVAQVNRGDAYARIALEATMAACDSAKEIMAVADDYPLAVKAREAVVALFTALREKSGVAVEESLGAECDNARTVYDLALGESYQPYPVVDISYQALQSAETTVEYAVTASEEIERIELQVLGALSIGLRAVRQQGQQVHSSAESTRQHIVHTLSASEEAVQRLRGGGQQ